MGWGVGAGGGGTSFTGLVGGMQWGVGGGGLRAGGPGGTRGRLGRREGGGGGKLRAGGPGGTRGDGGRERAASHALRVSRGGRVSGMESRQVRAAQIVWKTIRSIKYRFSVIKTHKNVKFYEL